MMAVHIPHQKRQWIDGDTDQADHLRELRTYTRAESAILEQAASILNVAVQDLPRRQEPLPRASYSCGLEAHLSLPHKLYQLDFDFWQNDVTRSDRQLEATAAVPISPSAFCYGVNGSSDAQPRVMLRDHLSAPISEYIGNFPAFHCAGTNVRTQSDPPSIYPDPTPLSIRNGTDSTGSTAVHHIGVETRTVEMGWIDPPVNGSFLSFHAESIPPSLELGPGITDNSGEQGLPLVASHYSASPTSTTDVMGVPGVYFNEQNDTEFQFQFDDFEASENATYDDPVVIAPSTQPQPWIFQNQQRLKPTFPDHFTIQQHSDDSQMPEVFKADLSFGPPPYNDALGTTDFSYECSQLTSNTNLLPDSMPFPRARRVGERQLELRGLNPYSAWTRATHVTHFQQETTAPERPSTTRNAVGARDPASLNMAARLAAKEIIVFHGPARHRSDERQRPRVRQSFQNPKRRKETGQTRKSGACVRCHMQKIRCSPAEEDKNGSCATCASISGPTLRSLPCVRYNIMYSSLLDKGQHPQFRWSQRWPSWDLVEIDTWASPEVKTITVTQDVMGGSALKIRCRQFMPVKGDSLARTWKKDGSSVYYQRAPYAILSMRETGNEIEKFVANNTGASIKYYIMVKDDKLLSSTYAMAYAMVFRSKDFAENKEGKRLLQEVFQLWVAIRMESQSERIVGDETLGMEPQNFDPDVNSYGTNSIPPMMSAQIELMTTTRILQPLNKAVLKRLQRLVEKNDMRSWFSIYLCMFVLLHSCSILTADEYRQAKKYGLRTRYVYDSFIEELHMGAKTMIYYFHYCNKGSYPFARDWTSKENMALAGLNEEQAKFLKESSVLIKERMPEFKKVIENSDFENDWYFVAQLYDMNWKP